MLSSNNASLPVSIPLNTGNNGGAFGGNGFDDIIALAVVAMIFGWGNFGGYGGWGGYGNGGQSTSVYEGYVLNNDFSQLSKQISDTYNMTDRKFEGLANGMCSMGYETQGLINGVNMNIANSAANITNAITTNGYENRLGQQGIQTQISNCCCDLKQLGGETNYNIANQANMLDRTISDKFCQTNFNNATNTRDIIDTQNAGTQAILSKLDAMETNRLREKLEAERDARYALQGQLDRAQLRTQIVDDIRPCPKPAYLSCNPWGCNCQQNVYGTTIA